MSYDLDTKYGTRKLEIQIGDIIRSEHKKDLLIISAFTRGYDPLPKTIIGALNDIGISIKELQKEPLIDMRESLNCWISNPISNQSFTYILCLEMERSEIGGEEFKNLISNLFTILAVLQMKKDIIIKSMMMPILGTGFQKRKVEDIVNYLLDSFKIYLDRYTELETITICDKDKEKVKAFESELAKYFTIQKNEIDRNRKDDVIQKYRQIILDKIRKLPNSHSKNNTIQELLTYLRKNNIEIEQLGLNIRKFLESIYPEVERRDNRFFSQIETFVKNYRLNDITKSYLYILKNFGNKGVHYGVKDKDCLPIKIDELDTQLVLISFIKILEMYEQIDISKIK